MRDSRKTHTMYINTPLPLKESRGGLGADPSGCVPLDAERDGGYPVRTNPAHLWPDLWASYRSVTIGTGSYGAPPQDQPAGLNLRFPAAVSEPPVD